MNKRRRALLSIVTIFGLLLFAFASFTKHLNSGELEEIHAASKHYYADNAGPASATAYLAEFKPRFMAFVSVCISSIIALRSSYLNLVYKDIVSTHRVVENSRPLWLVNRALLI